jgi:choline kinase
MQAVILAAGLGSRLKPFTNKVPKAMVSYNGIEIIKHQIETLLSERIDKITVVTGYKSKALKDFILENFSNEKIQIIENKSYSVTNSAFSAMKVLKDINTDYLHLNCDILFSKETLKRLINSSEENVISVRSDISLRSYMENIIEINGRIVSMSLQTSPQAKYKAFGLAKVSLNALKENIIFYNKLRKKTQEQENYFGLIRMTLGKTFYHTLECNEENLSEINTVEDLQNCKFIL